MKIACIVIGALLILWALNAVPRLVALAASEDAATMSGRAIVVSAEIVIGLGLILYGARPKRPGRRSGPRI